MIFKMKKNPRFWFRASRDRSASPSGLFCAVALCGPFWALSFTIFCTSCQTASKPPSKITDLQYLTESKESFGVGEFQQLSEDQQSQVGYYLYDLSSGQVIEKHNENQFFIPASTSKIPTTIAALNILGGGFRFKTQLAYRGTIHNHTLYGDLYLKGYGDPSLKVPDLIDFQKALEKKGIQKIVGHFYYDENLFKSAEVIEEGRESWAGFNSGVSALSSDFNQFKVRWFWDKLKGHHFIYSIPEMPWVQFGLTDQELSEETSFLYRKDKENDRWLLTATQSRGGSENLPIQKPALTTASLFLELCKMARIDLPEPESGFMPRVAKILLTHESEVLTSLVSDVLEYSNNLMAELIQLASAYELGHRPIDLSEASEQVTRWILKNAKIENPYHFVNGSGLSSQNRITPEQFVSILTFADSFEYQGKSFESLLPISGYKGGLLKRLSLPGLAFHVRAKTGSMNYADTLAGYLYTRSGRRFAFAIMKSDLKNRALMEQNQGPIQNLELKKINSWTRMAVSIQDSLIAEWIEKY